MIEATRCRCHSVASGYSACSDPERAAVAGKSILTDQSHEFQLSSRHVFVERGRPKRLFPQEYVSKRILGTSFEHRQGLPSVMLNYIEISCFPSSEDIELPAGVDEDSLKRLEHCLPWYLQ